jgi:hypothetical protein
MAKVIVCRGCGSVMSWAEQKQEFGRMIKAGMDKAEIDSLQPLCVVCVSKALNQRTESK